MADRFVDTSGWAEWADRSLLFHPQAVALFEEVWQQNRRLITTSYVLAELAALLTRPLKMTQGVPTHFETFIQCPFIACI